MRAQQSAADGDSKRELRYLLFAAQDIVEILKDPRIGTKDAVIARQYAESLITASITIERLLKEELNAHNTI